MRDPQPTPIYRRDYAPTSHEIETVDLAFELGEEFTTVRARLAVRAREGRAGDDLVLDGEKMELEEVKVDGTVLDAGAYTVDEEHLTLRGLPETCVVETTVKIKPQENTALEGLYKSSGNFCTQCEAEGFRKITYFLDRPDVMARYSTTIVADPERYPVLLSNGNRVEEKTLDDGRKQVRWEDPFPKPSYLFALVAGNLRAHTGTFTTASGRDVRLEIWVEPQNIEKCEHALRSLQKAMKWDEETFGLEYDLDIYMIVAVNDFNMGAMENKGLNVFNSKYVLAKPDTATDEDYESIEGVIGHEYFHNWTGNRVTCRDWFQLTLKEGLTVFRDQQFTADMTSAAVKRIDDVKILRAAQFPEDAGPMSHSIRPEHYIEMSNFYTATVYNKGAEVIRMYHTLLGKDGFRKGMDLYFERHDGQAVTCDDFRAAMADANDFDLEQFENWYLQRGTPQLHARGEWDEGASRYTLTLRQEAPASIGDEEYRLRHMPVRTALLSPDGSPVALDEDGNTERVLELKEAEQSFSFDNVTSRPVASVLRDFSAPVHLSFERSREDLAFSMAHETDAFNRWDAGVEFATSTLLDMVDALKKGGKSEPDPTFIEAWGAMLADQELDGSLKSLALELPEERVLGQAMDIVAVDEIRTARNQMKAALAAAHHDALMAAHEASRGVPYDADPASIHRRRLANTALAYLCAGDFDEGVKLASAQFESADNMTDSQAALLCLVDLQCDARDEAVAAFHARWKDDPLVLDKWFAVQALSNANDTVDRVLSLALHADFNQKNPNRLRSLVGVFGMRNQFHFHASDGRGYTFVADQVLEVEGFNPQTAARLVAAFNQWKRFDEDRQALQRKQLERIVAKDGLSRDVYEIVHRALTES
jgi:aminopeptidase N